MPTCINQPCSSEPVSIHGWSTPPSTALTAHASRRATMYLDEQHVRHYNGPRSGDMLEVAHRRTYNFFPRAGLLTRSNPVDLTHLANPRLPKASRM